MRTILFLPLILSWLLSLLPFQATRAADIPPPNAHHLCVNNGHVTGKWMTSSATKKTFYVCSWDAHDYKTNPDLCGDYIMQNKTLIHGSKTMNTQTGGRSSMCDRRDNTRETITPREKYTWEPMLCQLIPWDAALFCKALGARKIFLMGDSRVQQTAGSLMSRLRNDLPPGQNCGEQVYYAHFNTFKPFVSTAIELINATQPDIIVSNTGAHFGRVEAFLEDFANLEKIKQEVNTGKQTKWVWMTNNPGHVHCSQTSGGPLTHQYLKEQKNDKYHWLLFPMMDSMAKMEATRLGMKVIDMSPLYYRQDAHSDCLHFCLPGPLDLFSVLIMNMLYNKEL